ncbi:hypothetical protein K458DRAFT_406358 [Lentithecium fluviatile CBS 122367]|uniref:Nucleoporin Nup82 n=1 Tax=Lentithecium fluviatile CBS 122367 TaxID=1168545 RepID=A0A6G1IUY3_9PLEO|nr:hypothetical protein K458DRAFT_406358 [Lentithecium fluviatile CBS 122367]
MPRVLSYTPAWLARPSPGYHLFAPKPSTAKALVKEGQSTGLRKTIATRDSEVFVAVGREIRWADLALLKEDDAPFYRTLKVSIPLPIERLSISPSGELLAVSTSHTVHVITLPDYQRLASSSDAAIKPRTFQVGPTAHVLEESPIASVLWHPLGYHGHCLVTITRAGVVRLWEVNPADRSSFSEPTLSIDLEKLANAETDQNDVSASKYGATKGFSPDSVDLEVASACFGDFPDQEGVHGWAPMTLWIATIAGAVYALCPLLPTRWQLAEAPGAITFIQTLASSININYADVTEDAAAPKDDKVTAEKQHSWLNDILYQEPLKEELENRDIVKVFTRPSSVPDVPLLQGPFSIEPEVEDFELSDMTVYSFKTFSSGTEDDAAEGLPAAVVCLLTDTCQVHICLDLEGIVGRWLPSPEDNVDIQEVDHCLIVAETITLADDGVSSFKQSITPDIHTDFSFFVSHASGVYYVSVEPWIRKLETELSEPQSEGSAFRLKRLLESATTIVEQCIQRQPADQRKEVTSSVIVEDGNVGYVLLTTIDNEPQAAVLDAPEDGDPTDEDIVNYMKAPALSKVVREPWQPPKELWEPFDLRAAIDVPTRYRNSLKEDITLSPANLQILMNTHRVLAAHTDRLQHAVSDLFSRCQRLQDEYRDQILRTAHLIPKIDAVTGNGENGADGESSAYGTTKIEDRFERVKAKQEAMNSRFQALRKKMTGMAGTELSEKEASFVQELQTLESSLDREARTLTGEIDGSETPAWERLGKVKEMKKTLAKEINEASKASSEERAHASVKVPSHSRKQENEQVQRLLQHQTDLLEATTNRLKSFGISIPPLQIEESS